MRSRYENVDLIIVREATEDLYAGIEYEEGTAHAEELSAWIEAHGGHVPAHSGSRSSRCRSTAAGASSSSRSTTPAATAAAR